MQIPHFALGQENYETDFESDFVSGEERDESNAALRSSFNLFDFVENLGQWSSDVAYFSRSRSLEAWFESGGLRFDLSEQA